MVSLEESYSIIKTSPARPGLDSKVIGTVIRSPGWADTCPTDIAAVSAALTDIVAGKNRAIIQPKSSAVQVEIEYLPIK